jgi:hypothetical protein
MTPVVMTLKRLTWYRLLRHLRKSRDRRCPPQAPVDLDLRGPEANERIRRLLEAPEPCMIARFGNNEMRTVENYLSIEAPGSLGQKLRRYLRGKAGPWWWDVRTAREMQVGAGFYPPSPANLARFARLMLEDCREVDVLGSWLPAEAMLNGQMKASRIPLADLEPYFHPDPWSEALRGRKVLVIHPFDKSIRTQYAKREALFKDPRVLPAFDLQTFQSVQSIGGDCARFADWFEALEWMKQGIAALDFEIAIIGAGAYGMPLAAFIKRDLGRKAIHLGGATQILFGIKGKRFDGMPEYAIGLYNEAWTRPLQEERPAAAGKVEGGCYW